MKFRLKVGKHGSTLRTPLVDAAGKPVVNAYGKQIVRKKTLIYSASDPVTRYIESDHDLAKRFGADKFERLPDNFNFPTEADVEDVGEDVVDKDAGDEFSDMTVAELKQYAEEMEVELGDAKTKPQILKVLRSI